MSIVFPASVKNLRNFHADFTISQTKPRSADRLLAAPLCLAHNRLEQLRSSGWLAWSDTDMIATSTAGPG